MKEIPLYEIATTIQIEGILFQLKSTLWVDPNTVKFYYGVGGECKLTIHRNGTYEAEPAIRNKTVLKYLKSQKIKLYQKQINKP